MDLLNDGPPVMIDPLNKPDAFQCDALLDDSSDRRDSIVEHTARTASLDTPELTTADDAMAPTADLLDERVDLRAPPELDLAGDAPALDLDLAAPSAAAEPTATLPTLDDLLGLTPSTSSSLDDLLQARTVLHGRFAGRTVDGFRVSLRTGGERVVPIARIRSLGAAVVEKLQTDTSELSGILVVDLLLHPSSEEPSTVLRLTSDQLGLASLFPTGTSPRDAYRSLATELLDRSGARAWPNRDVVLDGPYERFADVVAFERACYG
jgi:hypothetical protein